MMAYLTDLAWCTANFLRKGCILMLEGISFPLVNSMAIHTLAQQYIELNLVLGKNVVKDLPLEDIEEMKKRGRDLTKPIS